MDIDFYNWNEYMSSLKKQLDSILYSIPRGSTVYYIDYPVHSNVGDLLIMLGTEEFFRRHEVNVAKRYSFYDCPKRLHAREDVILVFHGGGNFGDLYPRHQRLRERVIRDHTKHRIVLLPQTVHYAAPDAIRDLENACLGHQDLHIYLRDKSSLSFIKKHLPNAESFLVPDLAHELWPLCDGSTRRQVAGSQLVLARRDKERAVWNSEDSAQTEGMDWDDLKMNFDVHFIKLFHGLLTYAIPGTEQFLAGAWKHYAQHMVSRATSLYEQYESIKTSRLHGHILACLMGKPTVLLDNSYGKNSSYYQTWTREIPWVTMEQTSTFTGE